MFSRYDIYLSFDEKDSSDSAIDLLFTTLNSIGYTCWKSNTSVIKECPIFICFLSKSYIENSKSELEEAHSADKVILPVLIEKLKLSQTSIGHIVNENEVKYYSTFKKDFDWISVLTATIIEKFKRQTAESSNKKFDCVKSRTNECYSKLNRICQIERFTIIADWQSNAGVHVLDDNYEYLHSFNHNGKLKNVTGICALTGNRVAIVSSVPKSKENSVFVFKFDQSRIGFDEMAVLDFDKERDLCGLVYNDSTNSLYIADRLNGSIIEVKDDCKLQVEHAVTLPKFYKQPILGNLFHDQAGLLYAVDSKLNDVGNCCVHKFQAINNQLQWIGSLGNAELKKPVSVFVGDSSIVVLERSSPAVLHAFDTECKYKNSVILDGVEHCSSLFITDTRNLLITNLSKKVYIYDWKSLDYAEAKLDTIDRFQKLYHVFISYNQHSAKPDALQAFDLLTSNGYNCWLDIKISKVYKEKEIFIALSKVRTVLCLLTNDYIKSGICNKEIERSFKDKKTILIARMETISAENEIYINNLKGKTAPNPKLVEFDFISDESKKNWKEVVLRAIDEVYFRTNSRNISPVMLNVKKRVANSKVFKQINRLCLFDDVIVAGDWELGVGIHVFNLNYTYLETFNNKGSLKQVTGICKFNRGRMIVVSCVPNTKESSVFSFEYNLSKKQKVEFTELNRFIDESDKVRDLCGVDYSQTDDCVYVIDRIHCSILKLSNKLQLLNEFDLVNHLDGRFNTPILRDIKVSAANNHVFLTDSFSSKKHRGNNCIHVLNLSNLQWIQTIGEANLNAPCSLIITDSGNSIAVLERSNQGLIKYFKLSGEMFKIVRPDDSVYPTNMIETSNNTLMMTNDQKKQIIIYDSSCSRRSSNLCMII